VTNFPFQSLRKNCHIGDYLGLTKQLEASIKGHRQEPLKGRLFMEKTPEASVELSIDHYDHLLEKADRSSREYEILANGLIVRRRRGDHFERVVEISCGMEEAKRLLALARRIYPDAITAIEAAIANPRDP
jgi:hypothetical protein